MITLPQDWEMYIEQINSPLPEILDEIERETHWKTTYPQMLSGKIQASVLHFLAGLIRPVSLLEVGTFTGYATLAMADAMPENAKLLTLEKNPANASLAKSFFDKFERSGQIELITGDAVSFLQNDTRRYDFIFLDADKENYPVYFDLLKPKLIPGGLWVTDNVLWNGKVLNPGNDREAKSIAVFNEKVKNDPDLIKIILPVRDGLMVIRKK